MAAASRTTGIRAVRAARITSDLSLIHIFVEDSAIGIRAGKAAGAMVIALRDRDGAIDQRMADVIITQIGEILDYLS